VLVTAEYHVDPDRAPDFICAMRDVGRVRRRDGALRWGLFRDPAVPGRFLESFVVESWAEHLRQHERATMADREVEEGAKRFLADSEQPIIAHLVAARLPEESEPCTNGL
jgi:quinol monooxygenase YgiN